MLGRRAYDIGATPNQSREIGEELDRIDTTFRRRFRDWMIVLSVMYVIGAAVVLWAINITPVRAAEAARHAVAEAASAAPAPAPVNITNITHSTTTTIIVRPDPPLPANAKRWRSDLTRAAHTVWGLDAPVPAFAAQVHQESTWNPDAVSPVGAQGLGQFMPGTSSWWCSLNNMTPAQCMPRNPVWSLRALVGHDRWLWNQLGRMGSMDPYSKAWAMLRAYNGGLGHWQAEARVAGSTDRLAVDAACGRARRHRSHCAESLGYPKRILIELQPRYAAWGPVLDIRSSGGTR
ncbi:MAG: hypothetical protein RLZZ373_3345 [Pseudomonadota bacterium]